MVPVLEKLVPGDELFQKKITKSLQDSFTLYKAQVFKGVGTFQKALIQNLKTLSGFRGRKKPVCLNFRKGSMDVFVQVFDGFHN